MPSISIPADQALANVRAHRRSLWPDGRRDSTRLSGIAQVEFDPGFHFVPGEAVFTVGSCFARNIEKRLAELGFDIPANAFALPAEERASDTANDFLNKYPPPSILNEFRWALDPAQPFPAAGLLQINRELWHDLHSAPNLKPAPLERVRERRAMVTELYRQISRCRVVVITLGLIEAWWDQVAGVYLNGAPPARHASGDSNRFRLDVLTVNEVLDCLIQIHDLLIRFGHPDFRILLTVSPVPFRNTFTGKDAISANSYSKSVLRVAAEMFVQQYSRADYFPSYEIVTHTNRAAAYIQDNRHVTPQVVTTIVDRVVEAYGPDIIPVEAWEPIGAKKSAGEIHKAMKAGDFARAAKLYGDLDHREKFIRAGYDEFSFRYEYARVLMRAGSVAEAQHQLAKAVRLNEQHSGAQYQLGRALARLQRPLEAEGYFRSAVELEPNQHDYRISYGNLLIEQGNLDEAEVQFKAALMLQPNGERAQAALAAVQRKRFELAAEAAPSAPRQIGVGS